ncbi:hypothetical protein [Streptomyces sp. NPDC002990]
MRDSTRACRSRRPGWNWYMFAWLTTGNGAPLTMSGRSGTRASDVIAHAHGAADL